MSVAVQQNQSLLAPPPALLEWLEANAGALGAARISGESLKYFRSLLPVVRFVAPFDDFARLAADVRAAGEGAPTGWTQIESSSLRTGRGDEVREIKLILQFPGRDPREQVRGPIAAATLQPDWPYRNEPVHILITPEDDGREDGFAFHLDRLRWDPAARAWSGPEEALRDLEAGELRPIGLERAEDWSAERIVRVMSQSAMLDFALPEDLLELLRRAYSRDEAEELGRKFLNRQFRKILCGAKPSRAFLGMDAIGMLDWFFPELARGRGLSQNRYHKYDVFYHIIYTCDAVPEPDLQLRMAALFHDLGKVETRKEMPGGEASFHNHEVVGAKHTERICRRFGFPPDLMKRVRFLVRNHMFHYTDEWSDKAVRRFMRKTSPEQLEDLIRLRLADRKGSGKRQALPRAIKDLIRHIERVRAEEAELKVRDLAIDGHRLMELGMPPGPAMGAALRELLEQVKAGELQNEAQALEAAAEAWITEARSRSDRAAAT